jgi:purine-binding chemotaxis protein CheW
MSTQGAEIANTTGDAPTMQCLAFQVGSEVFAIEIHAVREIIQYAGITMVPQMPTFVRGVVNLRGAVVPVIDVRARFSDLKSTVGKRTSIIVMDAVVAGERAPLGLLVDAVTEVVAFTQHNIVVPPQFGTAVPKDFIRGMGKLGDGFLPIIDPARAFDIEEMALLVEHDR